jgi:uncharacterized protein (DUF4415 family)
MSPKPESDRDNPEWTSADFAKAKSATELPDEIRSFFPNTRGPQKAPKKIALSIRLSPEVVDHFKATGPGWQSRIDDVLKKVAGL